VGFTAVIFLVTFAFTQVIVIVLSTTFVGDGVGVGLFASGVGLAGVGEERLVGLGVALGVVAEAALFVEDADGVGSADFVVVGFGDGVGSANFVAEGDGVGSGDFVAEGDGVGSGDFVAEGDGVGSGDFVAEGVGVGATSPKFPKLTLFVLITPETLNEIVETPRSPFAKRKRFNGAFGLR